MGKNKKTTGNEEIREIMEEIKNAPKTGAITIDTDQKLDDGSNVHEHTEINEGGEIHAARLKRPYRQRKRPNRML